LSSRAFTASENAACTGSGGCAINVEAIQDMQIGYRDAVRNRRGGNVSSESLMLTKDDKIGNCCFSAKHEALRRKRKYLLDRNQDNVFDEWRDISTFRQLIWMSNFPATCISWQE
jgi:hypothetical protein